MKKLMVLLLGILLLTGCSFGQPKETDEAKEKSSYKEYKEENNLETEEETSASAAQFKTVTEAEAKEILNNEEITIIDVRSAELFTERHIPNAQNIPLKELETKWSELDQSKTYLIVCKVGKSSEMASTLLAENGFKNIYNMSGGMDGWTGETESN